MADDDFARTPILIVAGIEALAILGMNPHYAEKVRRYLGPTKLHWFAGPGENQACGSEPRQSLKARSVPPVLEPWQIRNVVFEPLLGIADPDSHQLIGLRVWQAPEEDGFNNAEKRGVDSDPQRKCRNSDGGEPGIAPKAAKGI